MNEKRSLNQPLRHSEVERLPLGFTPTSFGLTGQQIKRFGRDKGHPHTNRKATPGRKLQSIPVWYQWGDTLISKHRQIWHKNYGHIINK